MNAKKACGTTFVVLMLFSISAEAVVFRARATSVDGLNGAATIKFGHAAQNQEVAWSAPVFSPYAAVSVTPWFGSQQDSVFLSNMAYWAFRLEVWASPYWTNGDIILKIWAEDVSYPGRGWWGAFRSDNVSGPPGFSVIEVGSYDNPLITLTVPASRAKNGTLITLNQNPEPSNIVAMLTGLTGLCALGIKRRRAA